MQNNRSQNEILGVLLCLARSWVRGAIEYPGEENGTGDLSETTSEVHGKNPLSVIEMLGGFPILILLDLRFFGTFSDVL